MEPNRETFISVVIPTLNRYVTLRKLIADLNSLGEIIKEIIVVDSTNFESREKLDNIAKVTQYFTSHKNGLYQRFLGSKLVKSDWILFLDNDMELVSSHFFENLNQIVSINSLSGVALKFVDKHTDTTLNKIPKSKFPNSGFLSKLKGICTGYPNLPQGRYGYCGIRGRQPDTFSRTQWLSGGAFLAKRTHVFVGLNYKLLSYFEQKLGMGEDPLIGYMLTFQGDLYYYPEIVFLHNDQKDSAYTVDLFSYSKRVIFSRLFLSLERARLANSPKLVGYIYYHWHVFFRLVGLFFSVLIAGGKDNKKMFYGGIIGWFLGFRSRYRYSKRDEEYWLMQVQVDIDSNRR